IVQFTAISAAAVPLPGRGASSSRSQAAGSRHRNAVSAAAMLDPNGKGGPDSRQLRRRSVEADPNGKALGDDDPVDRAADDRQSRPVTILRLYTGAEAHNLAADRPLVRAHHPDRSAVAHGDLGQLGLGGSGGG